MDIGKTIKKLREAQKLTQEQVANTIGLDNSSYARIEKKGNKISVDQLEKIADALRVTVLELLTGNAQKVEDSEEVEKLKKRIEELESTAKVQSRELKWLSEYFLDTLKKAIMVVVKSELVWSDRPLFLEKDFPKSTNILEKVYLLENNTNKLIDTVTPLTANLYYFLLKHTYITKDEDLDKERPRLGQITISESFLTSEAIFKFIDNFGSVTGVFRDKPYDFKDSDAIESLKKAAKSLTPDQENLIREKREVLSTLKVNEVNVDLIVKSEGWKYAYQFVSEEMRTNRPNVANVMTIESILGARMINDEELKSVFK